MKYTLKKNQIGYREAAADLEFGRLLIAFVRI